MSTLTCHRGRSPAARAMILALSVIAVLLTPLPAYAAENLLSNPGFESGLDSWACPTGSVSTDARSGSGSLETAPSSTGTGECSQSLAVQPGSAYELSAWVKGSYAYIGARGDGMDEARTWTASAGSWTKLSVAFTTGPSTTSVAVYVHGWYGQPPLNADDFALSGEAGSVPDNPPAAPSGLRSDSTTATSATLSWSAPSGEVDGYRVYRDGTEVGTSSSTVFTDSGLTPETAYTYRVAAHNAAGEGPQSDPVEVSTPAPPDGSPGSRSLVGYHHSSFLNGSGYIPLADVSTDWDFVNLSFGESPGNGVVTFDRCPASECAERESDAEFQAAIEAHQAEGRKVLLSIGGANGTVRLTSAQARDNFVDTVSGIVDRWGLDGIDIDFEGHSLSLDDGDRDFRNPTTPVITNLIDALQTLTGRYGDGFALTMAPETFFVQMGYTFYGRGEWGGADPRAGAYLPVIHALRDDLTMLHVQHYNSGPIIGLDDEYHSMGTVNFHTAMADMVLNGFPIEGNPDWFFPGLREDQVAIGLPASNNAGNGFTSVGAVQQSLDCLIKGVNCGGYQPLGTYPGMRGLMSWSVNWDAFNGYEFSTAHRAYLDALP
ncbi:chitinase [Salininema proteolyticum]|uniref:chitinase n=1 Tax=Salininema proteolyticum TaxID=1607685 RepID=A0ABV8TYF4_9ACTN